MVSGPSTDSGLGFIHSFACALASFGFATDWLAPWLLIFGQKRCKISASSADFEATEIFVPVSLWNLGF